LQYNRINTPRPKKSLGQNYLQDENTCRNIVQSFNIKPGDHVIEIGPGQGAITKFILEETGNLLVVELDENNCRILAEKFPELEIINKDFLKLDFADIVKNDKKIRVIGNIPYNITSPIIFRLADERKYIQDAQLMIQEEVAQRIAASPDCKEYGIPSVILNVFSKSQLRFKVSRNCFYPKPKVDSRIIYFDFTISREDKIHDIEFFRKLVKAAFGTRRKTLRNSLKNLDINLADSPIDLSRRAENLSVDEFIELSNHFKP